MIEKPIAPQKLFPECNIVVEKRYIPMNRDTSDLKLDPPILHNLRVIPAEASSALWKLRRGDLKQFSEIHIETHLCPQITSICREYGPRIAYSIYVSDKCIEIYSECFDPELVLITVLGDLANILCYEYGYRGYIRYKRALVPRSLLNKDVIELVEKSTEQRVPMDIKAKNLKEAMNAIEAIRHEISELIISIPCLNSLVLEDIVPLLKDLAKNDVRIIFLTRPPHEADVSCYESLTRYLVLYLETISILNNANIFTCCSSVSELHIIVNRSTVISTYENTYKPHVSVVSISDNFYASNIALVHLRNCICFSHLVKEDRK